MISINQICNKPRAADTKGICRFLHTRKICWYVESWICIWDLRKGVLIRERRA